MSEAMSNATNNTTNSGATPAARPSVPLNDTSAVPRRIARFGFSKPYWDATRDKRLVLQYCKVAKRFQHYPRPVSIFTGRRRDLEWREVSGKGQVFTFTIAVRGLQAFRGHEPYAVALVTLDEGVNVLANVIHCKSDELHVGLRVKACWLPLEDGTHLLQFEPE
jgi:uncharacterized OB-fold protein